jgi:hypothetical protein
MMLRLAPRYVHGHEVDHAAEAELRAWAMQQGEQEEAGFAFEEVEAPPAGDDGLDHRDPADAFCLSFASPSVGERDPNAQYHDRYTGTAFA